jgi:hypothetical protein
VLYASSLPRCISSILNKPPPNKVPIPVPSYFLSPSSPLLNSARRTHLFELLAEQDELNLVIDGKHTSTSNTTEDVSTGTLEEGLDTLLGGDLAGSIEGGAVLDGLTRSHHHTTTDGVKRVRSNTSTSGDRPAKQERSKEVTLERTDKDDRLERVVHTEVQTTVDDDTSNRDDETTVKTSNTIGSKGLLVDVNETVELTLASALGRLSVVGKTGTSVVEGVDEEEGGGTSSLIN